MLSLTLFTIFSFCAFSANSELAIPTLHKTYDSLLTELKNKGFSESGENIVKVFLLGNRGVGKSLLGNAALGADLFHHHIEYSKRNHIPKEHRQYGLLFPPSKAGRKDALVLINIPGLHEKESEVAERNQKEFAAALSEFPSAKSAFLYVLNGTKEFGIKPADLETMHYLHKYMPAAFQTMMVVVNTREDEGWMRRERICSGYEAAMRNVVEKYAPIPALHVTFTYEVHHNQRQKFNSAQMQDLRWKMMALVRGLRAVSQPFAVPEGQLKLLREEGNANTVANQARQFQNDLKKQTEDWHKILTKVVDKNKDTGYGSLVGRIMEAHRDHQKKSLPAHGVPEEAYFAAEDVEL